MNPRANRWRTAAVAAVSLVPLPAALAEPTVAELLQRIEAQEQKILALERRLEIEGEADATAKASNAAVKASDRGFGLHSADGRNEVKLRGVLHFDGREFADDATPDQANTWLLRRVRPTLEGTVGGIYDFRFAPDFAGGRSVILDAFVTARLNTYANLTVGKFKVPVGLERLQSANDIRFIERAFPTGLLPNRDLGISLGGDALNGTLTYSFGYYNGVTDGGSSDAAGDIDTDSESDWAARIYATPFANSDRLALRGLGFGVAGTYVDVSGTQTNTLLPTYRTPGQQTFFRYRAATTADPTGATYADGERRRLTPQLYYSMGSFGLLGEYAQVSQDVSRQTAAGLRSDSVDTTAWQLAAHWFLTGEEQSFKGYKPGSVFDPGRGTWGAFEFVGRYHALSVDDDAFTGEAESFADPNTSARNASAWGIGLNWYLNQNLKWALDYERTSFEGGAAGGADREDEEVFLTRFALGF